MASIKLYLVLGAILAFIFGSLLATTLHYKGQYEKCEAINEELRIIITRQNEKIKRLEVDTKAYTLEIENHKKSLKERYKYIRSDKELKSCEAKLAEIQEAFSVFDTQSEASL